MNQSPDLPAVNSDGQGGLLGLTIDPAFAQNRMIYWVFSENVSGGSLTSVAKGKLSADEKKIENAVVIYRATPAFKNGMHYGGRIFFDRSGNIWVSTGERSDPKTRPQAQQLNSGYGKVIRITKEGKPVEEILFQEVKDPRFILTDIEMCRAWQCILLLAISGKVNSDLVVVMKLIYSTGQKLWMANYHLWN